MSTQAARKSPRVEASGSSSLDICKEKEMDHSGKLRCKRKRATPDVRWPQRATKLLANGDQHPPPRVHAYHCHVLPHVKRGGVTHCTRKGTRGQPAANFSFTALQLAIQASPCPTATRAVRYRILWTGQGEARGRLKPQAGSGRGTLETRHRHACLVGTPVL